MMNVQFGSRHRIFLGDQRPGAKSLAYQLTRAFVGVGLGRCAFIGSTGDTLEIVTRDVPGGVKGMTRYDNQLKQQMITEVLPRALQIPQGDPRLEAMYQINPPSFYGLDNFVVKGKHVLLPMPASRQDLRVVSIERFDKTSGCYITAHNNKRVRKLKLSVIV